MEIRRMMILVAISALMLGAVVQVWRWHQAAEFARKYALGSLASGSETLIKKRVGR
jgi:hypothetical protein